MLSMTSDYATSTGCPEPYLRRIADAGFTHVHWCHQWNTDFAYSAPEIEQIATWLRDYGLSLLDLHASYGVEKCWVSEREYERLAGVDLVRNRLEMTSRLAGDAIIMHVPAAPATEPERRAFWSRLRASLDALQPASSASGVRIAIENGGPVHLATVEAILDAYPADYVGLCYDSGHGNLSEEGLAYLARLKGRLISVHLHDNDGSTDQHKPIFTGTIDWEALANLIATSAYLKPLSFELSMRLAGTDDEREFLRHAQADGTRLAEMVAARRSVAIR